VNTAFADACYWVALLSPRDHLHLRAHEIGDGIDLIWTSEMVLTEVLNHFSGGPTTARRAAVALVDQLRRRHDFEVVPQDAGQFNAALNLYGRRDDKRWSLTDCASIIFAESSGITDILTHDHHFVQAGFNALLA